MCQSDPVSPTTWLALVAVMLLAALVAVVVLVRQLAVARQRIEELEQAAAAPADTVGPRSPRAVQAAGAAMRTAVETVSRVREHGVRSTVLASVDDFIRWAIADRQQIARVAGPDGTVTIMFSDIEGSTSLNSELGDTAWVKLLAAHDQLVRTWVDKHRGLIVKNQGDGYMVVFSTPELAVDASLDIQRALGAKRQHSRRLRRTPIRVRIGLHTGTAIERDGDWFGSNVAMAARVAAMADGGEILVTEEIARTLDGAPGLRFTEQDAVELKGLPGTHRLHLVEAAR
jgi:class 3 adenylate cyclase